MATTPQLIGPLTTAFVAPPDCDIISFSNLDPSATTLGFATQYAIGLESATRCFPSGILTPKGYYSPGICPSGWQIEATTNGLEKTHNCCPTGWFTLIQTISYATNIPWVRCIGDVTLLTPTKVAIYHKNTFESFATTSITARFLVGDGVQVRFKDSDFLTSSLQSTSTSPAVPSSSSVNTEASGLPKGAKIGIAVGVSLLAILVFIIAFFLLRRHRRQKKLSFNPQDGDFQTNDKAELPGGTDQGVKFGSGVVQEKAELENTFQELNPTPKLDDSLLHQVPVLPELQVRHSNTQPDSLAELGTKSITHPNSSPAAISPYADEMDNTRDNSSPIKMPRFDDNPTEMPRHSSNPVEQTKQQEAEIPSSSHQLDSGPLQSVTDFYPSLSDTFEDEDLAYQERRLQERRALIAEKERLAADEERLRERMAQSKKNRAQQ